jgi:dTMP kinase
VSGRLIVLEGADGVGKTTQVERLVAHLGQNGLPAVALREPGGTPLGERIRSLLLDLPGGEVNDRAELLLFLAARAQIAPEVARELSAGRTVVLDRFFLSTYAYQIAGRGLPEDDVRRINQFATLGRTPDLTIVLSMPPKEALGRKLSHPLPLQDVRGDRIERSGIDFYERVGAAFGMFLTKGWQREHPECGRIVGIDARGRPDEVAERVWSVVAHVAEA